MVPTFANVYQLYLFFALYDGRLFLLEP